MNALLTSSLCLLAALAAACTQVASEPAASVTQDQPVTQNPNSTTVQPDRQARGVAVAKPTDQPTAPEPRRRQLPVEAAPSSAAPSAVQQQQQQQPANVSVPVIIIEDVCNLRGAPQRVNTMGNSPAYIGPVGTGLPLVTVRAGTRLQVLSRTGDWLLVQFVGREMLVDNQVAPAPRQGFMNCGALTTDPSSRPPL
jgi:hypothetical protein